MTTVEILKAARAKIERGWCQGASAMNASGNRTHPKSMHACKWCSIGAISSVAFNSSDADSACSSFCAAIGKSIAYWNDTPGRTQSDVLAAFDKAIKLEMVGAK